METRNEKQVTKIKLEKIEDVKDFVNIVNQYDFDIDLSSGKYVVNAKSIMGIFSLELGQCINLIAHTNEPTDFFEKIKKYVIS